MKANMISSTIKQLVGMAMKDKTMPPELRVLIDDLMGGDIDSLDAKPLSLRQAGTSLGGKVALDSPCQLLSVVDGKGRKRYAIIV